jgi:cytochrome c oxidase subunit 4
MVSHAGSHAEEFDAHGHKDHGHVIVSAATLRLVLGALLFFTLLTVGAAKGEQWVAEVFNVAIPQWINVFVALSIAVVKTFLVVTFFMQLKYDNPLNTMIFVFTILTVAFFLGFTALDLGNRGTIDRTKARYIRPGGTGLKDTEALPITEFAKLQAKRAEKYDPHHGHHGHGPRQSITDAGYVPKAPRVGSSAQASRPVKTVTLPGFASEGEDEDDAHGEGPAH